MDLEIFILSKSGRQIPYDITFVQNLKYDTNELIYETDAENILVTAKGEKDGEGMHWKF